MYRCIPALAAPLVLLSIAAAPIPKAPEEPALYFPTKVGDKWTYTLTEKTGKDKDKKHELVEEVTAVEDKQGVKIITVGRLHQDGKMYWDRERHVSKDGVWDARDALSNEPILVPSVCLKLPHKPSQQWDERDWTRTAHGPERVKVPAGEFAAIRVVVRKRGEPKADPVQTEWFAPGVGIIKLETPRVAIEMKSFTPGK